MSGAADLKFELKVNSEGMVSGIKVATKSVEDASKAIKAALEEASAAAKGAGHELGESLGDHIKGARDHSEGFTAALKDFKQEAVASGRQARFFAGEIAELIPSADGARGAMQKFIAIGLEGFTLGAGIEAAIAVIALINEHIHEGTKRVQELRAAYTETGFAVHESLERVSDALKGPLSQTTQAFRAEAVTVGKDVRKELQAISKEATESAGSFFSTIKAMGAAVLNLYDTHGHMFDPNRSKSALDHQLAVPADKVRALEDKKGGEYQKVLGEEREKNERETDLQIASMEAALADEITKINAAKDQRIYDLRLQINKRGAENVRDLIAAEEEKSAEQIRRVTVDKELAARTQRLALATDEMGTVARIKEQAEIDVANMQEKLRRTNDGMEAASILEGIALRHDEAARAVEIEEAKLQKIHDATILEFNRLRDEKIKSETAASDQIEEMRKQFQDAAVSERYASAMAAVRKRVADERAIVFAALNLRVIDATEAQKRMDQITERADEDRKKAFLDSNKHWMNDFIHPVESSFKELIKSMVFQTSSLVDAMKKLFENLVNSVLDGLMKIAVERATLSIVGSFMPGIGSIIGAGAGDSIISAAEQALLGTAPAPAQKVADSSTSLSVHLHAFDSAGMQQLVESPRFASAIGEAMRNGRL